MSEPTTADTIEIPVWFQPPTGFFPLPLDGVEESLSAADTLLTELAPDDQKPVVGIVVGALASLLLELADRDAVYCALGHHLSAVDGGVVTSTLVVSLQLTGGEGDPRLLLAEMVRRRAEEDWRGKADLVTVLGRPVLFLESVQELPAPRLPGAPEVAEDGTAPVFTLEALVPADDGSLLAAVEFATPFVDNGPEFRAMMVDLAGSVSFRPPPEEPGAEPSAPVSSIRAALG